MCIHTETCTRIWPEALFVTAENNPDIFQWVNCADLHHGIQLRHKRNELDSQNLPDESERCYRVRETSPSCLLPDSIQGEHHTSMENPLAVARRYGGEKCAPKLWQGQFGGDVTVYPVTVTAIQMC